MPKKTYIALSKVQAFIDAQPPKCRMAYQAIVDRLEADGLLVEPYGKKLENDLFEIRIRSGRQIRVFYFYYEDNIILGVHAFIKKTQRTPDRELKQARKIIDRIKQGGYDG